MRELVELVNQHPKKPPYEQVERVYKHVRGGWPLDVCKRIIGGYYARYRKTFGEYHPQIYDFEMLEILQGLPKANGRGVWAEYRIIPDAYQGFINYYMENRPQHDCHIREFMKGDNKLLLFNHLLQHTGINF